MGANMVAVDKTMNILIADPYKAMQGITRGLLNQMGFTNIEEAGSGEAALEKLAERRFGLIISDWNIEPMTGLDLLRTVRQTPDHHQAVPFIMITGESKVENVIAAKEAGVSNYIVKPFNADTLRTRLQIVLGDF